MASLAYAALVVDDPNSMSLSSFGLKTETDICIFVRKQERFINVRQTLRMTKRRLSTLIFTQCLSGRNSTNRRTLQSDWLR